MQTWEEKGYDAYFAGVAYNKGESHARWLNGWMQAERESRGGHFDRHGRPTPCFG